MRWGQGGHLVVLGSWSGTPHTQSPRTDALLVWQKSTSSSGWVGPREGTAAKKKTGPPQAPLPSCPSDRAGPSSLDRNFLRSIWNFATFLSSVTLWDCQGTAIQVSFSQTVPGPPNHHPHPQHCPDLSPISPLPIYRGMGTHGLSGGLTWLPWAIFKVTALTTPPPPQVLMLLPGSWTAPGPQVGGGYPVSGTSAPSPTQPLQPAASHTYQLEDTFNDTEREGR
jgi:hypothetical protein